MAGDGLLTGRLGVHSMDDEVCMGLPRGGGCVKACQQGTGRIPWWKAYVMGASVMDDTQLKE